MTDIFEGVFDAIPPPAKGEDSISDRHREGVRAALLGHIAGQATKKENPFGYRKKPCDTFGFAGTPEVVPKRKKVDLNPWAQRQFKKRGWRFVRADRYDAGLQRHFDFMGIFDYVCGEGGRTMGVQVTTLEHAADHRRKILESPGLSKAREFGWEIVLLLAKRLPSGHFEAIWETI